MHLKKTNYNVVILSRNIHKVKSPVTSKAEGNGFREVSGIDGYPKSRLSKNPQLTVHSFLVPNL